MPYPWYEILDGKSESIQQGDVIQNCPILIPPANINTEEEIGIDFHEIDSIVLSQSCDLVNKKIEIVLVCPYYPLTTFIENLPKDQKSKKAQKKVIDNLRKGFLPGYHLLNNSNPFEDYQVVDFRNVYGVHFNSLNQILSNTGDRIRLLPPYREHLSQAFARYFMRVGLPQDIIIEGY